MVAISQFIRDSLSFFKDDLNNCITDPSQGQRTKTSRFVNTSYPKRNVIYPLVTIKIPNFEATRAGMQTTAMDLIVELEVRIWAKNEIDKDKISNDIYDRLRNLQFITTGSINNDLHDFQLTSAVEVEEDGEAGIKSRVLVFQYKIFNVN